MKQPSIFIPPTIPIPAPVIAYVMESVTGTLLSGSHITRKALSEPNAYGISICAVLEGAGDLSVLPNASKSDEITMFSKSEDFHGSGTTIHHPNITIICYVLGAPIFIFYLLTNTFPSHDLPLSSLHHMTTSPDYLSIHLPCDSLWLCM